MGVIEQLSASVKDQQVARDSRLSRLRDLWVKKMVRWGAVPITVATILVMLHYYDVIGFHWSWGWGCVLFSLLLIAVCLYLTFTEWFLCKWQLVCLILLTGEVISYTGIGTVGYEPMLLYIALMLVMLGTASILPWSQRYQVFFNLVCLTSWGFASWWMPSKDRTGLYHIAGLVTATALSWFTCYVRDRFVHDHEQSEKSVRESERTLRQMFDANTDGIVLVDLETHRIIDVNQNFLEVTGFDRDHVIGKTSRELEVWSDPASEEEYLRRMAADHRVENMEVNFRLKDGMLRPCLLNSLIVTIHGRPCIMSLARDVTDLRKSQEKLRESEQKFRLIFEASRDAIMVARASNGIISEVNSQFVNLSGFTREQAIGHSPLELGMWTAEPHKRAAFVEGLSQRGYIDGLELTLRNNRGDLIPVLMSAVTVNLAGEQCYLAVARDIAKIREAEQKIRASEATLRKILDSSLDWMTISDMATGDYLDVNDSFAFASGYTREEIIGSNFWKLGQWPDEPDWQRFNEDLVFTGEVKNRRATFRKRDGTLVPTLISAVQCELWGRRCCIANIRDISELSDAQENLRRSEERFRRIFDTSLDAMSISDDAGTFTDVNPEFIRASGFTREELIGQTPENLALWSNPNSLLEFTTRLVEKGEVRNQRVECRRKDGSTFLALVSGVITQLDGRLCCLGVSRDISDVVAAEEKVRKSEIMMRAIFDASLDNVALIDLADETLIEVNSEITKTIGYSREEMIGKRFDDLVPRGDQTRQGEFFAMLMQGREVRNFEMPLTSREGRRTFPALVSASMVEVDGRRCALSAARDITDLVKAREAALAASRAKSEFVSIMSHEIRTPMNAILGMADLMGESELNSEQRRYLDTILSNGNALLDLINSILDLAKVESGRLSLENVEFDLLELSEHAAATLAVRAHEKCIELAVHFPTDLAQMVTGDPYRLRQVLNNLIGNAIKFTRSGEVMVSVDRNRDPSIPGNFIFSVRDTGIGIAPDKIESIFSIFTQADTSTTRNFGGSGLGLAIVERLVGLMGGKVWVRSEVGKGSTFSFTVDLRIPEASSTQAPPPSRPDLRGLRTLLLIENATTRAVVAEMIRALGAEVAETASSVEALAAVATATRNAASFRLLLIDAELRSSDAYDALSHLRAGSPDAAVVLLTNSNGLPGKLRRMREHGVRHYLTKPIKRHELNGVVTEALSKSAGARASAETPRVASPASIAATSATSGALKILLADDSPDNRLLIRAYTKKAPYVITEAENGQIAVDRFMNSAFDLVLMDIQMPVLDGYSAVRAIRKWEKEKGKRRTPIIALTASALEEDVRRAKEAGCDMHVSKPVKKSTLLESVANAIQMASHGAAEEKVIAPPAVVPPAPVVAAMTSKLPPAQLSTFEI